MNENKITKIKNATNIVTIKEFATHWVIIAHAPNGSTIGCHTGRLSNKSYKRELLKRFAAYKSAQSEKQWFELV